MCLRSALPIRLFALLGPLGRRRSPFRRGPRIESHYSNGRNGVEVSRERSHTLTRKRTHAHTSNTMATYLFKSNNRKWTAFNFKQFLFSFLSLSIFLLASNAKDLREKHSTVCAIRPLMPLCQFQMTLFIKIKMDQINGISNFNELR